MWHVKAAGPFARPEASKGAAPPGRHSSYGTKYSWIYLLPYCHSTTRCPGGGKMLEAKWQQTWRM